MTGSRIVSLPRRQCLAGGGLFSIRGPRPVVKGRVTRAAATEWTRSLCIGVAVGWLIGAPVARADPAVASSPVGTAAVDSFAEFVAEASQRFDIPPAWICAVMRLESAGQVRALSPKGAMGLMQLMPRTWADLQARYGLGADPFDPHDNIIAGAAYLRELHDRYGAPGFLAAYNAGPARYEEALATGRPLPAETRSYLVRLGPWLGGGALDKAGGIVGLVKSWAAAPLFALRAPAPPESSRAPPDPSSVERMAKPRAARPIGSSSLFVGPSARSSPP
jgi:hypothetical protein